MEAFVGTGASNKGYALTMKLSIGPILAAAAALTVVLSAGCERGPQDAGSASGDPVSAEVTLLPACSASHLTADGELASKTSYTYGADGQVAVETHDADGDGTADKRIEILYTPNGKLMQRNEDRDGDGSTDVIVMYAYDFGGQLATERTDRDADGTIDAETLFDYDGYGNLRWSEYDANLDGDVDELHEYSYDKRNRLVEERVFTVDTQSPDTVISYQYDVDDRITSKLEERASTMHVSWFEISYEYDGVGNLLNEFIDFGADGEMDQVIAYSYAASGLDLKELDRGVDGEIDESTHHAYDTVTGFLIGQEIDENGDGVVDAQVAYDYSCWD